MADHTVLYVTGDETADSRYLGELRDVLDGVTVRTAETADEADRIAGTEPVECVVTDQALPDGTGLELLDRVRSRQPDTACILFADTGAASVEGPSDGPLVEFVDKGAPDAGERLARAVRTAIDFRTHTAYPVPDGETDRLDALSRLDLEDDALHDAVERLTRIAARHFGVPLAAVGIITAHTQEFLVSHGAEWSPIPREDTVCTYTILADDVTVIEDLSADPRFAENDELDDLDIRFYAGAPLRIGGTDPVGTLCVYDYKPREFDEADREFLRMLAEELVDQFTLRSELDARDTLRATPGEEDS